MMSLVALQGNCSQWVLQPGQMIDSDLKCQQSTRLKQAIQAKLPDYDNARPHTYLMTRQKLKELVLEVLMHPP